MVSDAFLKASMFKEPEPIEKKKGKSVPPPNMQTLKQKCIHLLNAAQDPGALTF